MVSSRLLNSFAIVGTIAAGWATDHIFNGKVHRMCLVCMAAAQYS